MITMSFLIRSARLDATYANKSKYRKSLSILQTTLLDLENSQVQQQAGEDSVNKEQRCQQPSSSSGEMKDDFK